MLNKTFKPQCIFSVSSTVQGHAADRFRRVLVNFRRVLVKKRAGTKKRASRFKRVRYHLLFLIHEFAKARSRASGSPAHQAASVALVLLGRRGLRVFRRPGRHRDAENAAVRQNDADRQPGQTVRCLCLRRSIGRRRDERHSPYRLRGRRSRRPRPARIEPDANSGPFLAEGDFPRT